MTPAVLESLLAEFPARRRWVVAFSGGLDSSVLLHLCASFLAGRGGAPQLVALHVNHAVHENAADWELHCARVCAALGVTFVARRAQLPDRNLRRCIRGCVAGGAIPRIRSLLSWNRSAVAGASAR
ncbi:MAG: hypothetical protein IPI75_09805 [Gammaproteobacteria bacterium]|nr:hypothetical protein [Gammaproteobacteria bacterium]